MEQSHEAILSRVLDRIEQNNEQIRPGTPLHDLNHAIEEALKMLPELKTDDFNQVMSSNDYLQRLIADAPEMIGWNADKIIEWIETIKSKATSS